MPRRTLPTHRPGATLLWLVLLVLAAATGAHAQIVRPTPTPFPTPTPTPTPTPAPTPNCERQITAKVVALNQVIMFNRLGAVNPHGLMYALERDVEKIDSTGAFAAGNVRLRTDKRPRPIVLRMNAGDCLIITFKNWIVPDKGDNPATPTASLHVAGLQLVESILSDGSYVGENPSSLVPVNGQAVYKYYAEREGNHLIFSTAATTGGEGDGGTTGHGLFGSVNVQARGAQWYRSQLTADELRWATAKMKDGVTPQTTGAGQPVINYEANYPADHKRFPNKPILKMLDGNEIIHSDLNAIITGPGRGNFGAGQYPAVTNISPGRDKPFREFTVIYHDETKAVQAFPQFNETDADNNPNPLAHTLHGVRDAFGINYGIGGIGAEIIANRLGIGPMGNCTDCLYEEFFLSAWAVGDPAMLVDRPSNTQVDKFGKKITGSLPATVAFYPDDPSNVHHSYLNDRVKMRVVHAGPKEHHVHHLHAHQWLRTPDSDKSSYLDSQAFGPGYAFTTEIAHGGSGNLNKTVGDSIFHCHFYPHFAQGMWELWRVHDVFESGTNLDGSGRPQSGARALPDGEIAAGTPIPALVPIPTIAMAPMPSPTFAGYPFYIPGVAGHRPPKPPLDTVDDGGLPRHVIVGGTVTHHESHDPAFDLAKARLDFDKHLETANAVAIPEPGTAAEQAAMTFHGQRTHPSFTPEGWAADFITNGLPRKDKANPLGSQPGAPYADPCVDKTGAAVGKDRFYKSANIQLDLTMNKAGWHFPQSRIATLWNDVRDTLDGTRPAEPFFFRAHSGDCITFHHTNLVPRTYVQDDFQVRTPTDVMGQHIHLVKFDVTSSDGAGNGWNYEDGTFSPGEVQDRIRAIRRHNKCFGEFKGDGRDGTFECPTLEEHPKLGLAGTDNDHNGVDDWLGAQTTIQRWYADAVRDNQGVDRTLNTVFTHDHFGPSTHQQAGFYAGLVVEKPDTDWYHSETGQPLSVNNDPVNGDGGPTSWQARINFPNSPSETFREFLLEFADFQLAYKKGGGGTAANPVPDPPNAINPPARKEIGLPFLVEPAPKCPGSNFAPPCPEAISAIGHGTMVVNYRNEPLALRVFNPDTGGQTAGIPGDLSHAYRSLTNRAIGDLNWQPIPTLTRGVRPGDPATPLLRVFENDKVRIRVLVGAHEEGHNFGVHGLKWLFEPADPNSGFRNNQMMGISEWFDFVVPPLPVISGNSTDFLYRPGSSSDDQWNGLWGIIRAYRGKQAVQPRSGQIYTDKAIAPSAMTASAATSDADAGGTQAAVAEGETAEGTIAAEDEPGVVNDDATVEGPLEVLSSNPDGQAPDVEAINTDANAADADTTQNFEGASGAQPSGVAPPYITPENDPATQEGVSPEAAAAEGGTTFTAASADSQTTMSGDAQMASYSYSNTNGVPVCPQDAVRRPISVTAVSAQMALTKGTLFYNDRSGYGGRLHDPTAILFVRTNDLDGSNRLKPGVPVEPLVIRARAGECIELTLRNRLPNRLPDLPGFSTLPLLVNKFNANQVRPSKYVGLHPQLLRYDVRVHDGVNVGLNPDRTVAPGSQVTYVWYAGDIAKKGGYIVGRPIEFGATSLSSSDPIKHSNKGAIGALIIEPPDAKWTLDSQSRAAGTVTYGGGSFREFVLLYQNDVNLRMQVDRADHDQMKDWTGFHNIPSDPTAVNPEASAYSVGTTYGNGGGVFDFVNASTGKNTGFAVPNLAEAEDSSDSGQKGFNYRTEPLWNRVGFAPNAPLELTNDKIFTNSLSKVQVGGLDSVTPIFRAQPGQAARFRVVMPGGHWRNESFMLHGHIWEEEPYTQSSTRIGANPLSEWKGVYYGVGAQSHFDFLPKNGAGGKFRVTGDYLYRTFNSFGFDGGLWGVFRVKNVALPTQVKDNQ